MASPIVPPINAKGMFVFDVPFDSVLLNNKEYTVKAIRSLKEMSDSGEKPYENIYKPVNLTETDYYNDVNADIPIVVLVDGGGNYTYIPASKIKSLPITTGIKYQETMLAVNLGFLPLSYNLDNIKTLVAEDIKASMGITSNVEAIVTSAVHLITEEKDAEFKKLLEANKTRKEGYSTKYNDLNVNYEKLRTRLQLLENYIKLNLPPNNNPNP